MKIGKWIGALAVAALMSGCVKSPDMERIAQETKKGLETSWADKGVEVTAVNLEPAGVDKYVGTVTVKGSGWEDTAKIAVSYKDEQISWTIDQWAIDK